jgi:hypothetical protein
MYYVAFFLTLYFLRTSSKLTVGNRRFYSIFSFILVLLNTISYVGIALDGQMMWIVHRNDPGGPIAYYYASGNVWWLVFANASQSAANFLADLLLVSMLRMIVFFDSF